MVEYAEVMSSGDTSPVPSTIDGTRGRWSDRGMPSRYAMSTVGSAPMSMLRRAYTALTEPSSAWWRLSMPEPPGSALFTVHVHEGKIGSQLGRMVVNGAAAEYSVVSGSMWSSNIAA